MFRLYQVPGKLFAGKIMYTCEGFTDKLDIICNIQDDSLRHYLTMHNISGKFRLCEPGHYIDFSIRRPGATVGYIKCNSSGKIIESHYYQDIEYTDVMNSELNKVFNNMNGQYFELEELAKIAFVQRSLSISPIADKKILYFIANFLYHNGTANSELIHNQFRAGYCLHFAMILKDMFKDGEICWCAPYGHMVYMHNNVPYDIEGVNYSDCYYYIPISYIKNGIKDFMHIPGVGFCTSEKYIQNAIKRYEKDNNIKKGND